MPISRISATKAVKKAIFGSKVRSERFLLDRERCTIPPRVPASVVARPQESAVNPPRK